MPVIEVSTELAADAALLFAILAVAILVTPDTTVITADAEYLIVPNGLLANELQLFLPEVLAILAKERPRNIVGINRLWTNRQERMHIPVLGNVATESVGPNSGHTVPI